jgi:5-methylcytosine-specific restriction protein A
MKNFIELITELTSSYQLEYLKIKKDLEYSRNFERELRSSIAKIIPIPFTSEASLGSGNWAEVPWVAIFHPAITDGAQNGFYIVYLINSKLKTVSLSLNQGVKGIENAFGTGAYAKKEMIHRAKTLSKRAGKLPKNFSNDPIALSAKADLGQKYAASHAFGRTYSLNDIEEKVFSQDLFRMIELYKKLVTENGYDTFEGLDLGLKDRTVKEKKRLALHYRMDRVGNVSKKVKNAKGYICEICNFDFLEFYGEIGKEYIEAHHLIPFEKLSINEERELDVVNDFAVLCANCHRMIHRQEDPSNLQALKATINKP